MRGNAWTEDGITLLRKLWAEGATAAAIGQRLGGLSRSAVLGKIFRLRMTGEGGAAGRIEQARSEKNAPKRRRTRRPRERIVTAPAQAAKRLFLLDLNNQSCRWPLGGRSGKYFFCGAAEADLTRGIPYCPRHMRRAYSVSVSFEKTERGDFTHSSKLLNIGARA